MFRIFFWFCLIFNSTFKQIFVVLIPTTHIYSILYFIHKQDVGDMQTYTSIDSQTYALISQQTPILCTPKSML